LNNQVVHCTISTWDDSDDDLIENDELCVENANDLNDEAETKTFLSNLKNPIHGSSS
jgi:hypothetical protein